MITWRTGRFLVVFLVAQLSIVLVAVYVVADIDVVALFRDRRSPISSPTPAPIVGEPSRVAPVGYPVVHVNIEETIY